MTNKTTEALKLAGKALGCSQQHLDLYHPKWVITRQQNDKALAAIREALQGESDEQGNQRTATHPVMDCVSTTYDSDAVKELLAEPVRKCDGLLCNVCGEYKQKYKDLPGLTEKDLCVCEPVKQEPVAWTDAQISRAFKNSPELHKDVTSFAAFKRVVKAIEAMHGYAAPVRTKDLTDDEIKAIALPMIPDEECSSEDQANFLAIEVIRAVIAADRRKNK